jgi:hypothetical protein
MLVYVRQFRPPKRRTNLSVASLTLSELASDTLDWLKVFFFGEEKWEQRSDV